MSAQDAFKVIRRLWPVVVAVGLVAAATMWLITPVAINTERKVGSFNAIATLLVTSAQTEPTATPSPTRTATPSRTPTPRNRTPSPSPIPSPTPTPVDMGLAVHRVALLVTTGEVPLRAAESLGHRGNPADLVAELRVRADAEVGTVTIGMQSKDSGLAVDRVNAFARATVAYFADELHMEGVEVTLVEEATPLPNEPSGAFVTPPTRLARTVVAGVLGLLFGIALVVVVEALGARLRSRQEVASALALPVFAEVPRQRRRRSGAGLRLTVLETPRGEQADGYRALKAAVLQAQRESISATDGLGQVVLVSSVGGEIDVSEVVANLAMTIAIDELSVLAVEADLREPGLHRWFDVPESDGVVGFLGAGPEAELEDYVRPTLMPKVSVLTAGSGGGDHPAFWVSQFPALVAEARAGADVVLLAASPILQASEVLDLLPLAQTVVIAVESGRLPAASARRLAELMTRFSHSEAGVVLFGADPVARKRRSRS